MKTLLRRIPDGLPRGPLKIAAGLIALLVGGQLNLPAQFGIWAGQVPEGAVLTDPVARLQSRMDQEQFRLDYEDERGYLNSLLAALEISPASQTLVFSKTSFQADRISPDAPRALYFNDDVYIGWVPSGPVLEIASVDPVYGTIFYTLEQSETGAQRFEREGSRCINCHLPTRSNVPIPRLLVMSVMPDVNGEALGANILVTTDRSPVQSRWGGWFVTGTGGDTTHVGNMVIGESRGPEWRIDADRHLTDLGDRFDTSRYPLAESDGVALMLLAHQSEVHNLIGEAAFAVRALEGDADGELSERTLERVGEAVEPLVRALLFVDAAPLDGLRAGDSAFAKEFAARGPRDSKGRSLRDLDLESRLLRYPLSYLIYSEAFDQLPVLARNYVYQRFQQIFQGTETGATFSHLTDGDREALMEILLDTKPSFRSWTESL